MSESPRDPTSDADRCATALSDPFRVASCPNCDYSREGLPDGEPCPECGMRFDPRAIVLIDDTGTEAESPARRRRRWIATALSFIPLLLFVYWGGFRHIVSVLWWMGPMLIALTLPSIWGWLTLDRRSQMQLWLLPEGLQLRPSTESGRAAKRIVDAANVYFIPIVLIVFVVFAKPRSLPLIWIVTAAAMVLALVIWAMRSFIAFRRGQIPVRVGDFELELTPWSALDQMSIKHKRSSRIALSFRRPVKLIGSLLLTHETMQFEAPCDGPTFRKLDTLIREWSHGRSRL